tara:strand:+ start:4965 stop:5897 length:933 start_codon:yes stop_codon:yes gene_type:complete
MACLESTAPINISRTSIRDKCNNKCQYFFKYNNSKCNIKNKKSYLQLSYDRPFDKTPVTYNGQSLFVSKVMIFSPSIHTYEGSNAAAEFIIEHRGENGNNMIVCIPIKEDEMISSKSSKMLNKIINHANRYTQNEGESVNLNLDQYNLDEFVPKSQFYAYRATYFMYPCNGDYQYTVFHKDDTFLTISKNSLIRLRKVIGRSNIYVKTGQNLYLSEKGPNSGVKPGDEIYIECKPTGTDGEVLQEQSKTSDTSAEDLDYQEKLNAFLNSPIFLILVFMLLFYVLYKIIKFLSNKLKDKDFAKPPTAKTSK